MLSEKDLLDMGLRIGAKNRILWFQRFFHSNQDSGDLIDLIKANELIPAMLEDSYSGRLIKFLLLATSNIDEISDKLKEIEDEDQ